MFGVKGAALARLCAVIENLDTRLTYSKYVMLPAHIGKDFSLELLQIILHAPWGVSGHHACIEQTGRELAFVDRSRHGSNVDGSLCHGARIGISRGSIITLGNYRVSFRDRVDLELVAFRGASPMSVDRRPLVDGVDLVLGTLSTNPGEVLMIPGECQDHPESADFVEAFALVNSRAGKWQVDISPPFAPKVALNNKPVKSSSVVLRDLDLLSFGEWRFSMVSTRVSPVLCGKADCWLLNPPSPPGQQPRCRFCNSPLTETSHTVVGGALSD